MSAVARLDDAARQRLHRRRQRLGLKVYHVEVDEFATLEWLHRSGRLNDAQLLDDRQVAAELSRLVRERISITS
jgi:hypothetical protein